MAEVRGLYQDKSGQRWAWNGYDYVKVGRDFDPRSSSFVSGVSGAFQDIGAGVQQIVAGIRGDDEALARLAQEVGQRRAEQGILASQNPLGYLVGQVAPYAGAAALGGVAGGLAGGTAGSAALGATAADVGLAGSAYGTLGERALAAGIGLAAPAAAAGLAMGGRALLQGRRAGTAAQRVQAGIQGPYAGGRAVQGMDVDPQQVSLAARMAGRMMSVGRLDVDAERLASTRRARQLARQYDIELTPAMKTGSRGMEQIEAALMSNPWSAAPGQRITGRFMERLQKETMDFLLPGYDGPFDEDFLAALSDDIARGYEEVAKNSNPIKTSRVLRKAQQLTAENQELVWEAKHHKMFNDLLNEVQKQGDTIQPEAAWNMAQARAAEAARRFNSNGRYQEGIVYQSVADALEDSLLKSTKGKVSSQDLDLLRKRYRVKMALENAGGMRGREGFRLASGYSALQRAFPRELGEGRGFAGDHLRQLNKALDMWTIGNKLFRPIVGDSGTATRLALSDVSPQGIGTNAVRGLAASIYYNEPWMAARPAAGAAAVGLTGGAVLD